MYPILVTVAVAVCVIALIGTIYIGKEINKSEGQGNSTEDDLASLQASYNKKNSSIRMLSIIYLITFIITVTLVAIFIF
ncbi:hypothetical protein [Thalassobacillus sp. CUG 92003]|uniref:hypothetical protein n=1 Tax=Thalassobacillus sp. CUG 92003 TaxID=2736641 RepID=UPI0015E66B99|nr:hypothetical protein [Thalassobacillus sp. CUG 92003]